MSDDIEQIPSHIETKRLTEVSSGTKCTLVSIERFGPRRHPGRKHHHPHRSWADSWADEWRENWERRKKKRRGWASAMRRHWFGGDDEHEEDPDCPYRQTRRPVSRGLMRRLMDLGITKGCVFEVVQSGGSGPVLIEVRGTRVAVGKNLACRILVKEVP
ncbi:MAG: ferrous iron transport protein A [Promethearchaeota archaeon]